MQRNELVNLANTLGFDASTIPNDSKLENHLKYLVGNGTAFSGTLATGTLTSDATAQADGDKVLIGAITYTFKTALSEAKATATLTSDATAPSDGETVTIEGVTYTFRTALSSPTKTFEVLIGVSAAVALDNLKIAINASGGTEGTEYSVGTTAHPLVTATTNTNTTQVVEAKRVGTYGNSFLTAETSAHLSWGGNLAGGVDPVAYEVLIGGSAAAELDNLKSAINADGTAGVYSANTVAHPQVTATTNTNTTQVVQARDFEVTNGSIATTDPTDTGNHMSWGATTLASGVGKRTAVDAVSVAQTGAGRNMNV
jgi:hypothetical protein